MSAHGHLAAIAVGFAFVTMAFAERARPTDGESAGEPRASTLAESAGEPLLDEDVELAVRRAVDFLWSKQMRNGRWYSPQFERTFPLGLTALTAFTLRSAGTPISDIRLKRAGRKLLDRSNINTVYARSFTLLFWCAVDPERLTAEIAEDVHFLTLQQRDNGAWGYGTLTGVGPGKTWTDNSNSQLALLALWEAAAVGADVKATVWRRAERSWLANINPDGGWGYPLSDDPAFAEHPRDSSGSMTAAGLASLYLLNDRLHLDAGLTFNGRFKARCGQEVEQTRPLRRAMEGGWKWLIERFAADTVPGLQPGPAGLPGDAYLTYYLYCVDRVGVASGRKRFGRTAWYPQVARQLIHMQQPDGSWGNVHQTCFGLLALLTGRTPVLINKLQYGDGDAWNNDPRDAANLTRWFSRRFETPLTWQIVDIDADDSDFRDAPVLLITGHEAPALSEAQRAKLRAFIHAGGTVLAVACCSRKAFTEGCRELFADMLPRLTYGRLPDEHPVWTMHDEITPDGDVAGFWDGCRTSVFLLQRGACCAWQQNLFDRYERLFLVAGNILRYATYGRSLRGRLTPGFHSPAVRPVWTVGVARMKHRGDWWVDPEALRRLSATLSAGCGLGIDEQPAVRASGVRKSNARVLWLTGHTFEPPGANGRLELKSYLASGGTLIASACCGRKAFDETFRLFAADLFGPDAFEPIDAQDPLITAAFAPDVASSALRPFIRPRHGEPPPKRFEWPELFGIRHDGRWVLIYSPYDITCGVSRHTCVNCVGYAQRDAEALAGNMLLYATGGPYAEPARGDVNGDAPSAENGGR